MTTNTPATANPLGALAFAVTANGTVPCAAAVATCRTACFNNLETERCEIHSHILAKPAVISSGLSTTRIIEAAYNATSSKRV